MGAAGLPFQSGVEASLWIQTIRLIVRLLKFRIVDSKLCQQWVDAIVVGRLQVLNQLEKCSQSGRLHPRRTEEE